MGTFIAGKNTQGEILTLYAARNADTTGTGVSIEAVEKPEGVPDYYLLKIANPLTTGTPPTGDALTLATSLSNQLSYQLTLSGAAGVGATGIGGTTDLSAAVLASAPDTTDIRLKMTTLSALPMALALGDVTGDGYGDFVAGIGKTAQQKPIVHMVFGSPSLAKEMTLGSASTEAAVALTIPDVTGSPVITAGNFNGGGGDTTFDVALGVTGTDGKTSVRIFMGRTPALWKALATSGLTAERADVVITTPFTTITSVARAGDLDGDGAEELLVRGTIGSDESSLYVIWGSLKWGVTELRPKLVSESFTAAADLAGAGFTAAALTPPAPPDSFNLWGLSTARNASGTTGSALSFGEGTTSRTYDHQVNYVSQKVAGAATRTVNLTAIPVGATVSLTFKSWLATENHSTFDKARVTASVVGTSQKTVLAANLGANETGTSVKALPDRTGAFESITLPLTAYAGQSVDVSFEFESVDQYNNSYEGWYVDDMQVIVGQVVLSCSDAAAATQLNAGGKIAAAGRVGNVAGDSRGDLAVVTVATTATSTDRVLVIPGVASSAATDRAALSSSARMLNITTSALGASASSIAVSPYGEPLPGAATSYNNFLITTATKTWFVSGSASLSSKTLELSASATSSIGNLLPVGSLDGDTIEDFLAVRTEETKSLTTGTSLYYHLVVEGYLSSGGGASASQLATRTAPDITIETGKPLYLSTADQTTAGMIAAVGNATGDGVFDLLVADSSLGNSLYLLSGRSLSSQTSASAQVSESTDLFRVEPAASSYSFSLAAANAVALTANQYDGLGSRTSDAVTIAAAGLTGAAAAFKLASLREVGDLNGDGSTDFFAQSADKGYIFFGPLPLKGAQPVAESADIELDLTSAAGLGTLVPGSGDLDGDGFNDLVFVRTVSTTTTVSILAGGTLFPRTVDSNSTVSGRLSKTPFPSAVFTGSLIDWDGAL
ncbi:MAG: immune inhibitor A, partial [Planctomycetes bacterium]|nr:immune inhibitor A [Planctomycetota bacterium]